MILYPWLQLTYINILKQFQQGTGHHALLICSNKGNGRGLLFQYLSNWLMCIKPKGIIPCGQCNNCHLIKAGTHPNFYQLEENKQQSISIDTIRILIDSLYISASMGGAKVVQLSNIELLTKQGTNALLKIIEEPPEKTYFLLGCLKSSNLLPTLLSRCLFIHLASPNETIGLNWLQQQQQKEAYPLLATRAALRLCSGAPLAAQALLQPLYWNKRIALCIAIKEALDYNDFLVLLPLLEKGNNDQLSWLLTLLIDAIKWHQGALDCLVNLDQQNLIAAFAVRWNIKMLHCQVQQWSNCYKLLVNVNNINRRLLFTYQLLNWEGNIVHSDLIF
ncbi:DNA polymerase III subunit delta' C-terminal domain-containing protein [Candidatus Palibaumannia cicadellinicola]|uniref:DNA polymerase III subunit delta' n=1 Tax=Baumannia cicadellinicola subsp. Homalodisca coagulata TaxID=374463 RepID=Q1LT43_BAUCH|nr:DNA polymerase III subunit delta' C-terminal domain-containing protein [Candidatus Baumannia cicadellinicola]ABF14017.1 DNA polymerase III, delta' subunit [Baumannia cicadellinicola str. Hc (Homalodisca coagulata)]MBS0032803.1 DNA polymerase III subunit delta' [Candidatus Baumannia cicadellinicola]MBS0032852.1 DNA polymerase III subunit delta' [Candidatus Baumannia cicadellinicola]MCJ7462089.1 DNA polymerase III subunit delta' [Candidatus Baumannia cicadellinicola]MCJ7462616.1 DNA polymeras